jgi:hypothetical protein
MAARRHGTEMPTNRLREMRTGNPSPKTDTTHSRPALGLSTHSPWGAPFPAWPVDTTHLSAVFRFR